MVVRQGLGRSLVDITWLRGLKARVVVNRTTNSRSRVLWEDHYRRIEGFRKKGAAELASKLDELKSSSWGLEMAKIKALEDESKRNIEVGIENIRLQTCKSIQG